jgi:hypothetical protein
MTFMLNILRNMIVFALETYMEKDVALNSFMLTCVILFIKKNILLHLLNRLRSTKVTSDYYSFYF